MTFLIIVLFVIAVLLLSNLAMKTTRVIVDNQYGRASAAVRINLEDEHYFFLDRPIENQLQMYRDILTQTGRYTVWPRLINFDDHWRTHESENTLPNRSLWFTVKTQQGKDARGEVYVHHPRKNESKKELPLLVQVNFKNEETTLSLKDIHENSDESDEAIAENEKHETKRDKRDQDGTESDDRTMEHENETGTMKTKEDAVQHENEERAGTAVTLYHENEMMHNEAMRNETKGDGTAVAPHHENEAMRNETKGDGTAVALHHENEAMRNETKGDGTAVAPHHEAMRNKTQDETKGDGTAVAPHHENEAMRNETKGDGTAVALHHEAMRKTKGDGTKEEDETDGADGIKAEFKGALHEKQDRNMQADAIAPKLYDSPNELAAQLRTRSEQTEETDKTERVTSTQKKRIFYFFHGGATFAGSPHKYNNLHWLKTVAWLSERNGLLTDVVSIDYRLQPENNMDESILDCVETLSRTLRLYRDSVEEVHLVGFSAGCLLTLQTVLLIEQSQNGELESLFGIDVDNVWLQQLNKDWSKIRNKRVHLLAPLVRLDRLFINDGFDCSSLLETFTKSVFEPNGARKYDALYWIVRLRSTLPTVEKLFIIDVCRNSLSNHAISLYMTLRHLGRNDTEGPLATDLTIFDESSFFVDAQLVDKIRKFELTRGLKPNKYTRDAIETFPKNSDAPKILNMLHYHFFPYIVLCEASWLTMTSLLTWAPVKNNSKQLKRDQNNLELLNQSDPEIAV